MLDESLVQLRSVLRLHILAHSAAVLNEENGILLLLCTRRVCASKDLEKRAQEIRGGMQMIDDVDLIVEDETVQNGKSRIVQDPRKNHVLEIKKTIGPVDLVADVLILNRNNFFELGRVGKILTVVRTMRGEVRVICELLAKLYEAKIEVWLYTLERQRHPSLPRRGRQIR